MADFTTVRKIRFGAAVRTSEGERGTLVEVVVDAATGAARAAGVRFGAFGGVAYAGIEHLSAATDQLVRLDVPRADLRSAPPNGARLTANTPVTLDSKRIGKLAHVTFDGASHMPLSLVVDRGASGEFSTSASGARIGDGDALALGSGRTGVGTTLTPYHRDSELREEVRRAIEQYGRMRVDMGGVDIQPVDGVVWLRGFVSSNLNRQLVEDLIRGTPGVASLRNELVTDSELAASIAGALARDPATADARIGVYSALGRVHLRGAAPTAAVVEAAGRVAGAGHGAREVVNDLRVDPRATVLPVLAGVTGDEDAVPGGR